MADDKPTEGNVMDGFYPFLLCMLLAIYLYTEYIVPLDISHSQPEFVTILTRIMIVLAGIVFLFVFFYIVKIQLAYGKLLRSETEKFLGQQMGGSADMTPFQKRMADRWKDILELTSSDSENDWKIAILNADILLDDMLAELNVEGESLGERLKNISRSDLNSLDLAWQAHKFRNSIAHDRTLKLGQHEVKKRISDYQVVFRELGFISV